jgi:hypothetical protein
MARRNARAVDRHHLPSGSLTDRRDGCPFASSVRTQMGTGESRSVYALSSDGPLHVAAHAGLASGPRRQAKRERNLNTLRGRMSSALCSPAREQVSAKMTARAVLRCTIIA